MKDLQNYIGESINEARNYPYRVSLLTNNGVITVTLTLDNPREAAILDDWLEDELDNTIHHATGGPNDIEL